MRVFQVVWGIAFFLGAFCGHSSKSQAITERSVSQSGVILEGLKSHRVARSLGWLG